MRLKGTLTEWNDDRGFGFLEPDLGGERAFCHTSQIQPIAFSRAAPVAKDKSSSRLSPWIAVVGSLLFLGMVSALAFSGRVPILLPPIYLVLSLITIFAYAFDKRGQWWDTH